MQFTFASLMAVAYLVLSVAGSALPNKDYHPNKKYTKYVTITDYQKVYKTQTVTKTKWKPTTTTCYETITKVSPPKTVTTTCYETITKYPPPKTVTTTCYETKYKTETVTKCGGDYCDTKYV